MTTEEKGGIIGGIKDGIVQTIKGVGEITDALVDTVSGSLVNAVKQTGNIGGALTGAIATVAQGTIQGASDIGGDLGAAAKDTILGVLKGTKEVGGASLDTISTTAGAVIKSTASVGGDHFQKFILALYEYAVDGITPLFPRGGKQGSIDHLGKFRGGDRQRRTFPQVGHVGKVGRFLTQNLETIAPHFEHAFVAFGVQRNNVFVTLFEQARQCRAWQA